MSRRSLTRRHRVCTWPSDIANRCIRTCDGAEELPTDVRIRSTHSLLSENDAVLEFDATNAKKMLLGIMGNVPKLAQIHWGMRKTLAKHLRSCKDWRCCGSMVLEHRSKYVWELCSAGGGLWLCCPLRGCFWQVRVRWINVIRDCG